MPGYYSAPCVPHLKPLGTTAQPLQYPSTACRVTAVSPLGTIALWIMARIWLSPLSTPDENIYGTRQVLYANPESLEHFVATARYTSEGLPK